MKADGQAPVLAARLDSLRVIEASAGTGKTWTIAGLYLRLLLEKRAPVEGILAITFTRAATAELRERIRARVQQLLVALEQGTAQGDALIAHLLESAGDRVQAQAHLLAALRSFDEAPIQTIHGFCQRALADHAFSSGVAFDCELLPDMDEVLHEVAADFWRREIVSCAAAGERPENQRLLAGWMVGKRLGLSELERWSRMHVRREGLTLRRPETQAPLAPVLDAYRTAYEACRRLWRNQHARIAALLRSARLSGRSHRLAWIDNWIEEVSEWAAEPGPSMDLPEHLDRFSTTKLHAAATGTPPTHAFFTRVDELLAAQAQAQSALQALWRSQRLDFIEYAHAQVATRFAERNAQSYDDLLLKLHRALTTERGAALAQALRQRYPYALIDEFQDTDALQWGIFRAIYGNADPARHAAFLVGDPKQAIYSFRGADVHAYLAAVSGLDAPLRLRESFRSVPGFVQALNVLFGLREQPFRQAGIEYDEIRAAERERDALVEDGVADRAPLRIVFSRAQDSGKVRNKDDGRAWAATVTADEIARLLSSIITAPTPALPSFAGEGIEAAGLSPSPAQRGRAGVGAVMPEQANDTRLGTAKLQASNIAILVNTGLQGRLMRHVLATRGIACAELSTDSVFQSTEAEQLERLLLAVASPRNAGLVRGALATDLCGLSANALQELAQDEQWERVLAEFDRYHDTWRTRGLMRMLRDLFCLRRVPENLAAFRDGERRLTNLYHLCELLHLEEQQLHGIDAVVSWLATRRGERASEETQLRLESDANLVQIVTIHRSKGLEYAVTFVPFLWDQRSFADMDDIALHHSPQPPHGVTLDAGSGDYPQALQRAREEELAEKLRVAYVALTRAKNRCYLFTGSLAGNERSALGWLLHGIDAAAEKPVLPDDDALRADVAALCEAAGGAVELFEPQAAAAAAEQPAPAPALAARRHFGPVPRGFMLTSFSALHAAAARMEVEPAPDHDQQDRPLAEPALAPGGERMSFPRGAEAGVCLHAILEHGTFAPGGWQAPVRDQLQRSGYPAAWGAEVERWLAEVVELPMPDPAGGAPLRLADVERPAQLRELAFQLAMRDFSPPRLVAIAREHGCPVSELPPERLRGYLSGFIDLVFRHRGRWYVADYKSNWLGAGPLAYAQPGMAEAMADGDYHLQYLLYTVALQRWLRATLADYDYERDLGGVLYLFLRGMHPAWRDEHGEPTGVFAARPARALVDALDDCLSAGTRERTA